MTRPPPVQIASWALSLIAVAFVIHRDAHFIVETTIWPLGVAEYGGFAARPEGRWYFWLLVVFSASVVSSPFWYGTRRSIRAPIAVLAALAPLIGLALLGRALTHPEVEIQVPVEIVVKPTATSWGAVGVWGLNLFVSLVALRRARHGTTDPEVFE